MKNTQMTWGWQVSALRSGLAVGLVFGLVFGSSETAMAQSGDDTQPVQSQQPAVRASEVGHSARAWLEVQRSNTQAAPMLPTLGSEAGLAYRRYMESFKNRIPDLYGSTLGGSGSNGGSPGGMGGSGGASGQGASN
jgi:Protein of unknown function (DUF3613)